MNVYFDSALDYFFLWFSVILLLILFPFAIYTIFNMIKKFRLCNLKETVMPRKYRNSLKKKSIEEYLKQKKGF